MTNDVISFVWEKKKNEIPLVITQWSLCFWWGGLQCFCSDKQINTFNALCFQRAHIGIWCWEISRKCERKHSLRSWAQKVAFQKIINNQTWTANIIPPVQYCHLSDVLCIDHRLCLFSHQMNDIMLYTYPQQDGKYMLKNTLSLSGMKVEQSFPYPSSSLTLYL